jgi:capsular polysaccharide transport system permease protein
MTAAPNRSAAAESSSEPERSVPDGTGPGAIEKRPEEAGPVNVTAVPRKAKPARDDKAARRAKRSPVVAVPLRVHGDPAAPAGDAPLGPAPSAPQSAAPPPGAANDAGKSSKELIRELRRQRGRRLALRLLLCVVLPTVLGAIYYGFVASRQYESSTLFMINSAEQQQSLAFMTSVLGSLSGAPATHDTLAARDYVLSRDMLKQLDAKHHVIAHYKNPSHDWYSRLSARASFEDAYEYYKKMVLVDYDSTTGSLTLRVRAFGAKMAHEVAATILSLAEKQVNDLTDRERNDQIDFAQGQVTTMEGRLAKARQALLVLQQRHGDINPQSTAQAAMGIRTALQGEIAKARAELAQARAYMNPTAPQVIAIKERIKALEGQAAQQNAKLVNPRSNSGVAETIGEFEAAAMEKEFAQKAYESARATLELARADSLRQHRYLVTISEPSMPDESTYPRKGLGVLTVGLVSFMVWGIGLLLVAAVREHAQV